MSEPKPTQEPTREEIKERTAKLVRRLGYVIFMGGGLLIFVPMLIGVGSGISNDRVWDPVTGDAVQSDQRELDCPGEARRLMMQAGRQETLTAKWDEPYRLWLAKCQQENPELYDLLSNTRQQLRRQ